jgi:curved DNA-binding protein CbpA
MPENDFQAIVEKLYAGVGSRRVDHFEILGLSRSATFQDIERSYRRLAELFSEENMAALGNSESAARAKDLRSRFDHAHDVLTDYAKRQEYENRGFKEPHEKEKIEQPPDMARRMFAKAKVLFSTKQYALCLEVVDKIIGMDPRAEYYHMRGLCLMNIHHRRHEAEATLLKATEIEPWNAEHFLALGMLFYNERLPQRALSYFKKTLDIDAGNLQARKKVEELEGPLPGGLEKLRAALLGVLRKVLPTFFRGR